MSQTHGESAEGDSRLGEWDVEPIQPRPAADSGASGDSTMQGGDSTMLQRKLDVMGIQLAAEHENAQQLLQKNRQLSEVRRHI